MNVYETVQQFILSNLIGPHEEVALDRDTSLKDLGVLDSLSTLKLLAFLEEKFRIDFDSKEINGEAFASLGAIERMIVRKQNRLAIDSA